MKYIKTYNEKLGDKILPPSDEEIWNKYENFENKKQFFIDALKYNKFEIVNKILNTVILYDSFYLYTIDEYLFKIKDKKLLEYLINLESIRKYVPERVYLIEKYIFGLHLNEEKKYETFLNKISKNLELVNTDRESTYYIKNDYILYEYYYDFENFRVDNNIFNYMVKLNIFNSKYQIYDAIKLIISYMFLIDINNVNTVIFLSNNDKDFNQIIK